MPLSGRLKNVPEWRPPAPGLWSRERALLIREKRPANAVRSGEPMVSILPTQAALFPPLKAAKNPLLLESFGC